MEFSKNVYFLQHYKYHSYTALRKSMAKHKTVISIADTLEIPQA